MCQDNLGLSESELAKYRADLQEPYEDPPLAVQAKQIDTCSIGDFLRSFLAERLGLAEKVITDSSAYPIEHDLANEIAMLIGAHGITNGTCIMASDCRTVGAIMKRFA